jgi:hydroxyacylglutathione hydrolase
MKTRSFEVGSFSTNCYVVGCAETKEAVIIDPGFDTKSEAEIIIKYVEENCSKLKTIVNTHGHPDHTCGNGLVKNRFNVPIAIHKDDAYLIGTLGKRLAEAFNLTNHSPPADILLDDGSLLEFGKEKLEVIHTPGHSPGSISLLGKNVIFTGDTLFASSIGRTDFPESSEKEMQISLKRLKDLPDNLTVYPGHGPATTLGKEKRDNPFLTGLL